VTEDKMRKDRQKSGRRLLEFKFEELPTGARPVGGPAMIDYLVFDSSSPARTLEGNKIRFNRLLEKAPDDANAYVLGQQDLVRGMAGHYIKEAIQFYRV